MNMQQFESKLSEDLKECRRMHEDLLQTATKAYDALQKEGASKEHHAQMLLLEIAYKRLMNKLKQTNEFITITHQSEIMNSTIAQMTAIACVAMLQMFSTAEETQGAVEAYHEQVLER